MVGINIIIVDGVTDVFNNGPNQSSNQVSGGGSVVAGNQYNQVTNITRSSNKRLDRLYQSLTQESATPSAMGFCEKLKHYLSSDTNPDIRSLESKLSDSDRSDMIFIAAELKEYACKAIMRYQSSKTAQEIYVLILDKIHTDFMLKVTPLIQSGADRVTVDAQTSNVLECISEMLGDNLLDLSEKDLLGLLYFLAGNCHIRWDKC